MNKNSKPAEQVLSELMQRSLTKDAALAAKQARFLEKLKNDPSSPLHAGSTPSPQPAEASSKAARRPDLEMPDELAARRKHRERQRAQLIAELKAIPPIRRGTVEESLERWLESQEPTAGKPSGQIKPIKG